MHKPYRDESRLNYGRDTDGSLTREELQVGALMRIADAVEKMARRHTELIEQRDYYEREAKRLRALLDSERRRTAALRGVIKRRSK